MTRYLLVAWPDGRVDVDAKGVEVRHVPGLARLLIAATRQASITAETKAA